MQKILHQIWVGPYEMPDREKFFTNEIRENHPDLEYRLWTNDNLPELPENLKAVYDKFGTQKDYAHQADVLRVFLVKEFGGIYLDVDFKLVNGFDRSLFDYEGFFCYHGGNDWTMPNGIFGGSKDSRLMNFLFEQITPKTGWYGPSWLGDTVKKYFELEREADHSIVDEKLTSINNKYLPFQTLEREMIKHLALYSWGPENKKKFEEGNSFQTNKLFGHEVVYFKTEPDRDGGDFIFKEWTLFKTTDRKCVKVVVPNNTFPDNKPNFTEFGVDFEIPFEIHIDHIYFQSIFGPDTQPRKRDYLYFPLTNRMYEIQGSYLFRGFMMEPLYWKIQLTKFSPNIDMLMKTEDRRFLDNIIMTSDELFGKQAEVQKKDALDKKQYKTISHKFDETRRSIHPDLSNKILDHTFNYAPLIEYYYDMSGVKPSIVNYSVVSGGTAADQELTPNQPYTIYAYQDSEIYKAWTARRLNSGDSTISTLITSNINMNLKVSFVCTTYRRFRCVERIIEQYLRQDYPNKELIIFNTDTENPMRLDESLVGENIHVINNSIDYKTGVDYANRGQICRDAVTHATGDLFMLADDDDIYLPWHIRQAVDGITANGKDAWKPRRSFFATSSKLEMCQNTLEASVIVKMNRIREIGFRDDLTGYEGLNWYTKLRDEKQLDEYNDHFIPSYCFNWSDPSDMAGHKQSGDINNPNNFENHKTQSRDVSNEPLKRSGESLNLIYQRYYDYIKTHRADFDPILWDLYVDQYVNRQTTSYDYVEIGTSDFDVSDGSIDINGNGGLDPAKRYLLVEPIKFYLDRLPDGPNIDKANYAISDQNRMGKIHFLPAETIEALNFPYWAKGCNKLDQNHPTIENDLIKFGHSPELIQSHEVECITFGRLLDLYNIGRIGKLAIDTEGHDHLILKGVVDCVLANLVEIDKISFEVGFFNNGAELDELYRKIAHLYPVVSFEGANKIISKA